jgi:hypothetical protein
MFTRNFNLIVVMTVGLEELAKTRNKGVYI